MAPGGPGDLEQTLIHPPLDGGFARSDGLGEIAGGQKLAFTSGLHRAHVSSAERLLQMPPSMVMVAFANGLDESNPGYAVVTVAHEIGHALGAADTYDPTTGLATIPGGFITPHGTELYPQRFAELMSPDVPISPGEEQEVESLYQVKVGHQTASQMRWITEEEADAFYAGPTGVEPETTSPGSEDQASESETIGGDPTD